MTAGDVAPGEVGSIGGHAGLLGFRLRLLAGVRFGFRPLEEAEFMSFAPCLADLSTDNGAGRYALAFDGAQPSLPPGHYVASVPGGTIRWIGADTAVPPIESIVFLPKGRGGVARFTLSRGATALRFGTAGCVSGTAGIRRLTRLQFYAGLCARLAGRNVAPLQWPRLAAASWRVWRNEGVSGVAARLRAADGRGLPAAGDYAGWLERHDAMTPLRVELLRRRLRRLPSMPAISIAMRLGDVPGEGLRRSVESVRSQIHERWELLLVADAATPAPLRELAEGLCEADSRIRLVGQASHAAGFNAALAAAGGDWIAALDAGDLLRPAALAEIAIAADARPAVAILYGDGDRIDAQRRRCEPEFRPDFAPEFFYARNYLGGLVFHRTGSLRAAGGWPAEPGEGGDFDLVLRTFEDFGEAAIGHVRKLLHCRRERDPAVVKAVARAERGALLNHFSRIGLAAAVEQADDGLSRHVRIVAPDPQPLVSLIIPTRDRLDLLRNCLESIRARTLYRNHEIIIVDNDSKEAGTLAWLDRVAGEPGVRVLRHGGPFNFPALNNVAVSQARGELIGLVNNDIEVIAPGWLGDMAAWAMRPGVGCVGARLLYGDGTVQHAGVVLGIGGMADHAHLGLSRDAPGHLGRAMLLGNYSAVTGACLVMRKAVYEEVGGLNGKDLAVAFNDVDLCLRVRKAGYRHVWTPYAELRHLESQSRGRDDTPEKRARYLAEVGYMRRTWAPVLDDDPYYSPFLSRLRPDFSLVD